MPVYDGRNAKIRGLWKRGDKFYARLSIAFTSAAAIVLSLL